MVPDDTDRVSAIATPADLEAAREVTAVQIELAALASDPTLPARVAARAALSTLEALAPFLLLLAAGDRAEFVRRLLGLSDRLGD